MASSADASPIPDASAARRTAPPGPCHLGPPTAREASADGAVAARVRATAADAFAPLPGTPSAFDSPFGGTAWSQPETPGVSNAPPSFEDHVANPMRGGYEAPGIEDPEGV